MNSLKIWRKKTKRLGNWRWKNGSAELFFGFNPFIFQSSTASGCWPSSVYFFQNDLANQTNLYAKLMSKIWGWWTREGVKKPDETVSCVVRMDELDQWTVPMDATFGLNETLSAVWCWSFCTKISSQRICKDFFGGGFLWNAKPEVGSIFASDFQRMFVFLLGWGLFSDKKKLWWIILEIFQHPKKMTCQIVGESKMCLDQLLIVCR